MSGGGAPTRLTPMSMDQPIGHTRGEAGNVEVWPSPYFAQVIVRILAYLGQPLSPGGSGGGSNSTIGEQILVLQESMPVTYDPSLFFNNGTLAVASIPGGTLSGNPGIVAAPPTTVFIGSGLSLSGGVLSAVIPPAPLPSVFAPLVNGDLPGPTPIADAVGQFVMVQVR